MLERMQVHAARIVLRHIRRIERERIVHISVLMPVDPMVCQTDGTGIDEYPAARSSSGRGSSDTPSESMNPRSWNAGRPA